MRLTAGYYASDKKTLKQRGEQQVVQRIIFYRKNKKMKMTPNEILIESLIDGNR